MLPFKIEFNSIVQRDTQKYILVLFFSLFQNLNQVELQRRFPWTDKTTYITITMKQYTPIKAAFHTFTHPKRQKSQITMNENLLPHRI